MGTYVSNHYVIMSHKVRTVYQLHVYDNDLDLKAFSELLNFNSKFRLNINYVFHLFKQYKVNAMCHSVGHMLRTVTGGALTAL